MVEQKRNVIMPQQGFQTAVLSSPADVLIMGGSAGCGKTFCLLAEPLRYVQRHKNFAGIIFRREYVQISFPGGLWDKSVELYSQLDPSVRPTMKVGNLEHVFPSGAKIAFDHISSENSALRYQGTEFAYIGFDELTHFTQKQFFYMMTRNRSTSGVRPLLRASTNPQGSGWVKELIAWYLYPDDWPDESKRCFPIPERSGVLRYFVQTGSEISDIVWGETREQVWAQLDEKTQQRLANVSDGDWGSIAEEKRMELGLHSIKSFSFIFGLLRENKALLKSDPTYMGNLLAQDETTVAQLLEGRWVDIDEDAKRLYRNEAIEDLFTNSFVSRTGERFMTCDIALEGSDKFVVVVWDGWVAVEIASFDKSDGTAVLATIKDMAIRWKVPGRNIAFDADGVGGFLKGFFRSSFAFSGNAAPIAEDGKPQAGRPRPNYANLRAQVYYKFKDVMEDCGCFIAASDAHFRKLLSEELRAIKKGESRGDGKLRLAPKELVRASLGRSPDFADAVVMRCVFDMMPSFRAKTRFVKSF